MSGGDTARGRARARGDGRGAATPLASVLAALRSAEERGELTPGQLEWSTARLLGRARGRSGRMDGLDGMERHDSILRASAEVFRRRGYNRATIEEIAAELSLTKAGVYHYFGSKQEILEGLCDRAMAAAERAVKLALEAESEPLPRTRHMLERYADAVMHEPAFTVLMRHLDEVGEASLANLQKRRKVIEARFRRTIEEGVRAGVFETPDIRVSVFGMLGVINWLYAWFEGDGRLSAEEVREVLVTLALNGILTGRPPDRVRR